MKDLPEQIEEFKKRLVELKQKVAEDQSAADHSGSNSAGMVNSLLEELSIAMEELRVQNEELLSNRLALEQERERYKELFDFAPDGYLVTDMYGVIHAANQSAGQMLNVMPKHLVGKPIAIYIVKNDLNRFRSFLHKLNYQQNNYPLLDMFTIQPREGKPFPASISVTPSMLVESLSGQNTSFRWLFRDVTELHDITEKLKVQNESLEQRVAERTEELIRSNRELHEFAFIASHDMKEPMRKVKSFSEIILKRYSSMLPDEAQDYFDRMMRANERMEEMLDGLLNYARVTTRAEEFRPTDLNKELEGVLFDLELLIEQFNGQVQVKELPVIDADLNQIRQLLQNLITNAMKFHRMDVHPSLEVWAEEGDSGRIRLLFKDNGIGIAEESLEEIYKPFRRLNSPASYRGSGMGLSICQKIVERHHGNISVSSEIGKGSTFTVTLPIKQDTENIV
jgi:PAS domain S-box-containing protein